MSSRSQGVKRKQSAGGHPSDLNVQETPLSETERLSTLVRFGPELAAPDFRFTRDADASTPHDELTPEALVFVDAVRRAGWVSPFDWASWAQTAEGQDLLGDPCNIASASPDQIAKVLTVVIRGERFSEGTLSAAFESGLLLAVIRRAETLLNEHEVTSDMARSADQREPEL